MSPASRQPRGRATRPGRAGRLEAAGRGKADLVLGSPDATLLDVVDNALNKGVVLTGDLTIALAQVDLVYLRLSLLLCAADRVMPGASRSEASRRGGRRTDAPGSTRGRKARRG